jgi:hypothetical protein|tara:strand:- start:911 stop:1117 length:207 start_codon:yes stop_codon:yes gene_type:complete
MITKVMGYKVDVEPNRVFIYDHTGDICSEDIPNSIVSYLIEEGFCDEWITKSSPIKVNIYKKKSNDKL